MSDIKIVSLIIFVIKIYNLLLVCLEYMEKIIKTPNTQKR
jgi:hypothetical protein